MQSPDSFRAIEIGQRSRHFQDPVIGTGGKLHLFRGIPEQRRATRKPRPNSDKAREAYNRGKAALIGGKLSEAEDALSACLKLDPGFADCHRNLGVLYAKKDDTLRAVKHYKKYIELAPNAKDAERVRAMLKDVEAP